MSAKKAKSTKKRVSVKDARTGQVLISGKSSRNVSISQITASSSGSGRHRDSSMAGSDPMPPKGPKRRTAKAKVDSAGRVLVPAPFRKALAVESGDEVKMVLKDGVLEIRSLDDAVREAQALVRRHVSKKKSLVKELIKERRKEAARE